MCPDGLEQVLAALRERGRSPRPEGNGWKALCPAHDDKNPSLSIGEGDDGRVLLHCFAGCKPEAVVAALNLEMADLMPPRSDVAQRNGQGSRNAKPVQMYRSADEAQRTLEQRLGPASQHWDYHDAQGNVVGRVIRWNTPNGKVIRPISRHGDSWRIGAMPEPRPLYGQPELLKRPGELVFVVEGEKCADALMGIGLLATTSAGGAEAAAKTDWTPLARRRVVILRDNDEAGLRYANDVARLALAAGATEVRLLELSDYAPDLPPGGDVADVLESPQWCGLPLGDAAEPKDFADWLFATARSVNTRDWPEIIPFDSASLPDFPTHVLPDALRRWVEAESHATQTPPDLAGLLALAVCSACIARRVEIEPRPGWREPVNLFVAVLLEPGNRKSAVFADAMRPLRDLEAELIEAARPTVAREQSEHRQLEARLRKLEKQAAEKDDPEARREALDLAAQLAQRPEPVCPRLIVDDTTAEKLGMMLAEQGGRIASMSAEGGVFDLMAGLYNKSGIPQFDVYLKGHSGDDVITDRVGRKGVRVKRPALVCAYTMQPQVIQGLVGKAAFRGRGLLARFLYAAPQSWIGRREIAPNPVADTVEEAYRQAIRALAKSFENIENSPFVLRLSADAKGLLYDWETEIEAMLADGGAMENMRDWGGKLAGATLRLAAVLHCVERGRMEHVDRQTLVAAIEIARYLIPHAEAVLNMMLACEDTADGDAQYVLRWIERHGRREFTKSEAQQHGKRRFPVADDIDPALAELERRGYIRPQRAEKAGPGRPPSPSFEVNPVVFENANPEKRSKYSKNSASELSLPPNRESF